MRKLSSVAFPIALGLTLPVHLAAVNSTFFHANDLLLGAVVSITVAAIMLAIGYLVYRDLKRASVFAAALVAVILLNGMFRALIAMTGVHTQDTFRPAVQIPLHIVWLGFVHFLIRRDWHLKELVHVGLAASCVSILISAGTLIASGLESGGNRTVLPNDDRSLDDVLSPTNDRDLPNVLILILDGYGRSDVLRDLYDHENDGFENSLREMGFHIFERSVANYPQTVPSLTTLLGMEYVPIDSLKALDGPNWRDHLWGSFADLHVPSLFRSSGYRIVLNFHPHEAFPPDDLEARELSTWYFDALTHHTSWPVYQKALNRLGFRQKMDPIQKFIKLTLDRLQHAAEYTSSPQQTFALHHVMSPHPPFVLGDGNRDAIDLLELNFGDASHLRKPAGMSSASYRRRYAWQVESLNEHVVQLMERILEQNSNVIILLTGDHGPGSTYDHEEISVQQLQERLPVFQALYLPSGEYDAFPRGMSMVNVFRHILRAEFGYPVSTIPDSLYGLTWDYPQRMRNVTSEMRGLLKANQ